MKPFLLIIAFALSVQVSAQQVKLLKLEDLFRRVQAGGDTTYIINFWATWCGSCLEELPNFEKLSGEYSTSKLRVILVSLDFRSAMKTAVVPYVHKKRLTNEVFLLDETDPQWFINRIDSTWSGAIPATLFINRDQRKFFEQQFDYEELKKQYQQIKTL